MKRKLKENLELGLISLFLLCVTYIAVVSFIMRIRHPEYTETQLWLKMSDAILLNF